MIGHQIHEASTQNPLDYRALTAMLRAFHKLHPKHNSILELTSVLL